MPLSAMLAASRACLSKLICNPPATTAGIATTYSDSTPPSSPASTLCPWELQKCSFPPLPTEFTGFPSPKELKLSMVRFVDDGGMQLEDIIHQSPLPEVLNLSYVVIEIFFILALL
jgi:hypothetical protein